MHCIHRVLESQSRGCYCAGCFQLEQQHSIKTKEEGEVLLVSKEAIDGHGMLERERF